MQTIDKPGIKEYPASAAKYIDLIPGDGRLLEHLRDNFKTVKEFILSLPEEKLYHRYAEGKWSIKEVLVHIIDDERIYSYRALCFARNDRMMFPGFDEMDYTFFSNADQRDIKNILEEYEAVRNATIALFNGLSPSVFTRQGIADNKMATVRAMAYHIAGHELHHFNIIKERYMNV